MPHASRRIVGIVLGLLVAPFSLGQAPQPAKAPKTLPSNTLHKKARHKPAPPPPMVLPPMPSGPLPQVPMDQLPPAPPRVSYKDGMLTIVAQNSTLNDILREVHNRTGASIDVPSNPGERVVTRLGPGPARDVLASLLNGSTFNYVMLGSASDPASVTTVILTTKTAGGPGAAVAAQPNPGIPPARVPIQAAPVVPALNIQAANAEEDKSDENADDQDAEDNAEQEQTTPGVAGQPDANPANPPGSPEPNAGPKTPEQILEMLRKLPPPNQPPPQAPPPADQQPPE
jgi:hypothetical protein